MSRSSCPLRVKCSREPPVALLRLQYSSRTSRPPQCSAEVLGTEPLPIVVFSRKVAFGGTSMELTAECRTFFSQL
ncbi:hypothetical protein CRUP_017614 [Coryphaenoides rupestris]|nr:hypothetical protein CRUP_017614 [Coryphaenoides rupestris]